MHGNKYFHQFKEYVSYFLCHHLVVIPQQVVTYVNFWTSKKNLRELLDMIVPHLHELLLPRVDVGEIVDHLRSLDTEPLWVGMILFVVAMKNRVRGYR